MLAAAFYSRNNRVGVCYERQVSWLSPKSPPSRAYSVACVWAFPNGDDSSGHCSGLAPDSLLCCDGTPRHHQFGRKITHKIGKTGILMRFFATFRPYTHP